MIVPELRRGRGGKFTPASLRDYWRARIANVDGMDRERFALGILAGLIDGGTDWSTAQRRAVLEGLRLGQKEGIR